MTLVGRLIGVGLLEDEEKLPIHTFMALVVERSRGEIDTSKIVADLALTREEQTDLDEFVRAIIAGSYDRDLLHDVLIMGEAGYYTEADIERRLQLNFTPGPRIP